MKLLKLILRFFKKETPKPEEQKPKTFCLIPLHSEPIFGNSFIDPKDPVFDHPFALSLPYLMAKDESDEQHLFI